MMRTFTFAALLLLGALAPPRAATAEGDEAPPAQAPAPAPVAVTRDVPYVAAEAGAEVPDRQRLDLYVPAGAGPWPALLWIHGGAWAVGHRKKEEALARRLCQEGIAVAAIDHRMSKALWIDPKLSAGVEHPAHVQDCAAAFAWLAARAAAHRLDPARLFVGGFSSGAHLSALLATDPKYLKAHGLALTRIRGALPVGGAYDMAAYYRSHLEHNGKEMAEQHVLDVFGRGEGALADASPTTHMTKSRVPMLVLSERDTKAYTKRFEDAVTAAGLTHVRFMHCDDRTHRTIQAEMLKAGPDGPRDALVAFLRAPPPPADAPPAAPGPRPEGG